MQVGERSYFLQMKPKTLRCCEVDARVARIQAQPRAHLLQFFQLLFRVEPFCIFVCW